MTSSIALVSTVLLGIAAVNLSGPSSTGTWSEGEPSAFPKYPGRSIYVLSGIWDFAFLGNLEERVVAAGAVKEEDLARRINVPDAFDMREWLCSLAPSMSPPFASGVDDLIPPPCGLGVGVSCSQCCDLTRGPRGDERCFGANVSMDDGGLVTFHRCCDPVALGRRGVAAYRTFIPRIATLERRVASLLRFGACSMHCSVFLDRRLVGEHFGGYSPFWVDLSLGATTSGVTEMELLVLTDNRFSPRWPVHQAYFDWYQPGGILRPVELHMLLEPRLHFWNVEVMTESLAPEGIVKVRARVSGSCLGKGSLLVMLAFDRYPPLDTTKKSVGSDLLEWTVQVPQPRVWSPLTPHLHTMDAFLWDTDGNILLDAVTVRFGLRTVKADGSRLLLNGKPLRLQGVNRHETHPHGGIYLSTNLLRADALLLREMGANFVRGAHYSQDQRWLDLCDEMGLLVWEETLGWQPKLEHLINEVFLHQQVMALEETINASFNHPSVILWGFLNEGETNHPAARPAHHLLADRARALDPSRLVTWASRHKTNDETLDLADVISFNDYPGWYDESVGAIPRVWRHYGDWLQLRYPSKPTIASESGAEGLVGFKGNHNMPKWSEEQQAAIISTSIASIWAAGFNGIALWQFADSRVDTAMFFAENPLASPMPNVSDADWVEAMAVSYEVTNSPFGSHLPLRPRTQNNKGLVSLDRLYRKMRIGPRRIFFEVLVYHQRTL